MPGGRARRACRSGALRVPAGAFFDASSGASLHAGMLHWCGKPWTHSGAWCRLRERLKNSPAEGRDIIIEDGVWLASFVTVIGPARLGKNSVAAAGSLIIGDMEPNSIYAGHPAKLMRKIVKK